MEVWAWLLAYVVGFGLLQLVLYRYFSRERGTLDGATPGGSDGVRRAVPERVDGDHDGVRPCHHCGASNAADPVYTYCRECATPLE